MYERHNGHWVFQSNYESGLRLLHFDPNRDEKLVEYGYFDVYPSRTTANFQGTWSNYPFGLRNGMSFVRKSVTQYHEDLIIGLP